jgi:hypothetical protein
MKDESKVSAAFTTGPTNVGFVLCRHYCAFLDSEGELQPVTTTRLVSHALCILVVQWLIALLRA